METLHDALLLFRREIRRTLRSKVAIFIGMVQPALYLALFGPLLKGVLPSSGTHGSSWQVYVPGVLVQLSLFGAGYAGFALIPDLRAGVVERMRVTPVSRLALLGGRVLRDVVVLLVQAVTLLVAGLALGLRAPLLGVLISLALVVLLGASLASLSYVLAMALPTEYQFAPVLNTVALPLMLLSGILLPMWVAPDWLDVVSHVSPFRYVVDGMRAAFLGDYAAGILVEGVIVAAALTAISLALGRRQFVKAVA